jgi:regulator of replication initiation timing
MMWILINELADVVKVFHEGGCKGIFKDYVNPWNAFDWINIVTGFALMAMFFWCTDYTNKVNAAGEQIGKLARPIPNDTPDLPIVKEYVDELEAAVNWVTFTQKWLARYPLIIVLRLFKSFHAQPRLAIVTKTIQVSMEDLSHFLLVFACVFFGFVTSAVVLFGREVTELSNFFRCTIFCTRLILGDIDYDALKTPGRMLGGTWMIVFMVIASLLLLNMLLAIVMDSYSEVKSGSMSSQTLFGQLSETMKNMDGMHVPMKVIVKALQESMPEELKLKIAAQKHKAKMKKKKAKQEAVTGEDEQENADEEDEEEEEFELEEEVGLFERAPLKIDELISIVAKPAPVKEDSVRSMVWGKSRAKTWNMSENQAKEILIAAIMDYYDENQESADNFEFISMAEKINTRVYSITFTHKRFNTREDGVTDGEEPSEDEDEEKDEDEDGEKQDEDEEKDEDEDPDEISDKAKGAHIDVRVTMERTKEEFQMFLSDIDKDRTKAMSEIARLNVEVEALRDRLAETAAAPGAMSPVQTPIWGNFLANDAALPGYEIAAKPAGPTAKSTAAPKALGAPPRLSPLSEGGESEEDQVPASRDGPQLPRSSPIGPNPSARPDDASDPGRQLTGEVTFESTDQVRLSPPSTTPASIRPSGRQSPPQPKAAPAPALTAEKLSALQKKPQRGPSSDYVRLMKRQGLLPTDWKVPEDQASSADWEEEASIQGTSPPGSVSGRADRGTLRGPEHLRSSGSSVGSRRSGGFDEGSISELLSDYDESELLDDNSDAGNRSQVSDDDMGDAPVGVPFRVHNTRVVEGVGLTGANGNVVDMPPPAHDFEFTTFKDAQSQLRSMLSKHRPMESAVMNTRAAI